MQYLKADTVTEVLIGTVVAVGDGFTPVTSLTIAGSSDLEIIKHGATTVTAITGTLAAITSADGYYALDLVTGDVDTEGRLTILINDDSLCLPVRNDFMVVSANVFDSLFAAATTDYLQTDTIQWIGTAYATPTTNGVPEVDVTQVAGTAQTAGDLAAMITTVDDFVDTEITAIKTKTDFLPSVTAGAAGGLMIAGSNAATTFATLTVTGATVFTGNVSYAAGITITKSDLNSDGVSITGNGSGSGLRVQKGAAGYDIQGDIQGNLSGSAGSVTNLNTSYIDTTISSRATPAQVNTEVDTALADINLDHIAGTATGIPAIPAGTYLDQMMDDGTAVYDRTTDSLQAIRDTAPLGTAMRGTDNAYTGGNITGNLSGSVGSVTGAVGSVTGDVGGNVTGSVGSIASNGINNNSLHPNACSKITDSGIQRGASHWENNSDDRSLGWAISKLVNKIDLNAAGDTLTIRKSNDSTALFTQAVTTSGGAAPVVSLDTTG